MSLESIFSGGLYRRQIKVRKKRVTISPREKERIASGNYELDDEAKDLHGSYGNRQANRDMVDPPERKRIPEAGTWVMIVHELPALEHDLDEHVRIGRIFYAERADGADAAGFSKNGTYKIKIRSPWGEVCVWPHEYSPLTTESILAMWQDGELIFNPTEVDPSRVNEIVFYCQSRCISITDAMVMALGTLAGPVGWFEPSPDLVAAVEDMGRIGGPLTEVNHERRRAAQARKREGASGATG